MPSVVQPSGQKTSGTPDRLDRLVGLVPPPLRLRKVNDGQGYIDIVPGLFVYSTQKEHKSGGSVSSRQTRLNDCI